MKYVFDCSLPQLKQKVREKASGNPFKTGYFCIRLGNLFYVNYLTDPLGNDCGCLPMIGFMKKGEGKAYVRAKRIIAPMLPAIAVACAAMCLICYVFMYPATDTAALCMWAGVGTAAIIVSVLRNYIFTYFDVGYEAEGWLHDFWKNMGGTDEDEPQQQD